MNTPVFMYHALYREADELHGADKVYAISYKKFDDHIRFCEQEKRSICSLSRLYSDSFTATTPVCVFTFDDGHASNYEAALRLVERGYSADLFINSAYINTEHYMTDIQLKEVSDAGISIQSHGHEHVYFSDLPDDEIYRQLTESKRLIEGITGKPVSIFAPPGGRVNRNVTRIAANAGYVCVANSRPGVIRKRPDAFNIPRLPIQENTNDDTVKAWLKPNTEGIWKLQCKYGITRLGKTLLGNRRYEALRNRILG